MLEKAISGRKVRKRQVQGIWKKQAELEMANYLICNKQTHTHTIKQKQKKRKKRQTKVQAVVKICTKQINLHNTETSTHTHTIAHTRVCWEETKRCKD